MNDLTEALLQKNRDNEPLEIDSKTYFLNTTKTLENPVVIRGSGSIQFFQNLRFKNSIEVKDVHCKGKPHITLFKLDKSIKQKRIDVIFERVKFDSFKRAVSVYLSSGDLVIDGHLTNCTFTNIGQGAFMIRGGLMNGYECRDNQLIGSNKRTFSFGISIGNKRGKSTNLSAHHNVLKGLDSDSKTPYGILIIGSNSRIDSNQFIDCKRCTYIRGSGGVISENTVLNKQVIGDLPLIVKANGSGLTKICYNRVVGKFRRVILIDSDNDQKIMGNVFDATMVGKYFLSISRKGSYKIDVIGNIIALKNEVYSNTVQVVYPFNQLNLKENVFAKIGPGRTISGRDLVDEIIEE